jgi:hypothetical protein
MKRRSILTETRRHGDTETRRHGDEEKSGYAASDVGQALFKLGYDKAARERFLASVPGLTVRGTGANKNLVF